MGLLSCTQKPPPPRVVIDVAAPLVMTDEERKTKRAYRKSVHKLSKQTQVATARWKELDAKAKEGELTPQERAERRKSRRKSRRLQHVFKQHVEVTMTILSTKTIDLASCGDILVSIFSL